MPGKSIEIRDKTLGSGTPLICTPLVGRTAERVLAEAASVVAKKPDSSNGVSTISTASPTRRPC